MAYPKIYKEKLEQLEKDLSLNDLLELIQDFNKEGIFSENITRTLIDDIDNAQSRIFEITQHFEYQVKQRIAESLRFYLVYKNKKNK